MKEIMIEKMMRAANVFVKSFPNISSMKPNVLTPGVTYSFNQKSTNEKDACIHELKKIKHPKQIQFIDSK
jgi:hypothetical protein